MTEEGQPGSMKRSLDEPNDSINGETMEEEAPPRKKQKLSQSDSTSSTNSSSNNTNNNNNNSSSSSNNSNNSNNSSSNNESNSNIEKSLEDLDVQDEGEHKVNNINNSNSSNSTNSNNKNKKMDVRTVVGYNRPTHFEISATNCVAIIDFYTKVFGWKFTKMPHMEYWGIQTGPYSFGMQKDQALSTYGLDGGLQPREGDGPSGDAPNTFMLYIDVENIDETIKLIKDNGGSITKSKTDVGGMGFLAHAKDIEGGILGIWQNVNPIHVPQVEKSNNDNVKDTDVVTNGNM